MGKCVKLIKDLEYTDGNGEVYHLKNAIVIDLTGGQKLEDLLEEAIELDAQQQS